ncbi:MAG: LCP family protein [Clostridia bacterium]|nr:LCP family protein [Clostridia bacterium]
MKLGLKIGLAVFLFLCVLALGYVAVFVAESMRLTLILLGCAASVVIAGLVLGIILSRPLWLKLTFGFLVLVIAVAGLYGYFYGAAFMSNLNEGSVGTTARNTASSTHAPMPTLEYVSEAPSDEEFDVEIDDYVPAPDATPVPIYEQEPTAENIVNILILGQDADRLYSGYGRSDVMLLVSYNRVEGTIKLLSFMRDTYVPIEGFSWNRLNTCLRFGGPGLIINTLNELFELDIQNYVTLAFDEFKTLVDSIGGIDIELSRAEARHAGASWAGEGEKTHLTGAQALRFVRNRSIGRGDFSRTDRHRRFMTALYSQIREDLSVVSLLNLINFSKDYVRTNLSFSDITELGLELLDGPSISIETASMPFDGTWSYARVNGASVLPIDIDANRDKIHEYLYGE